MKTPEAAAEGGGVVIHGHRRGDLRVGLVAGVFVLALLP